MSITLKIAIRYLTSVKGSTLLITFISFFGVFLSVSAILLTIGVFTGFQDTLKEKILSSTPHIIISIVGEHDPKYIKRKIEPLEDIRLSIPFTLYSAILAKNERLQPVTVKAVNYRDEDFIKLMKDKLVDGKIAGIIVGEGIAENLNIKTGKEATLVFPTGIRTPTGFIPKTRSVVVGGIFRTGTYDKDFVIVYMDEREAKTFFKRGFKFEGVEVYIKDPYKAEEIKKKIEEVLNDDLIFVRSWIDLNKPLFNALQLEKLALFLILLLMVAIASFNITSLLFVKTREKIRDIAILKTFGFKHTDILKIFITVGLIIGISGAVAGIIFSYISAYFINKYRLIRVPEEVYLMNYIPVHIDLWVLVATFSGTVLLSFLSSLIPALKASRENVVNILRTE